MIDVNKRQKYWDYDKNKELPTKYCVVTVIEYSDDDDLFGTVLEKDEFVPTKYADEEVERLKKKYTKENR